LLEQGFFEQNTIQVAFSLLGASLFVAEKNALQVCQIVETEAYRAGDLASHCSAKTKNRSALMFQKPGIAYVYLIYGMYPMLNVVTEPEGCSGAVLIRAVEPLNEHELKRTDGPGRLTKALGISTADNGKSMLGGRFWFEKNQTSESILCSPRVGIRHNQEAFWRFYLSQNPFVSKVKENEKAKVCKQDLITHLLNKSNQK
jgi:DNA-3-methyladenine glycosylase